jgi:NAD(P)-dependent dehydrogenase (short-subunit alcohol dehydrogenase family)
MSKKVVVITGASSGIGLATAGLFVEKGYAVYGLSRRKINKNEFSEIQTDVNDDESVKKAIEEVLGKEGRIDILINNAGFAMVGAAEESSISQIKSMFETNFFGAIRATNAVLPVMRKQRSGRILHTSSIVGFLPGPYMTFYTASKHALEGYAESLDHEVREFGIRSILVEPSFMNTSINSSPIEPDLPVQDYAKKREQFARFVEAGVASSPSPELVAKKFLEAVEAANPKLRYPVGKDAARTAPLRRFAPASLFDKIFRANFKLD